MHLDATDAAVVWTAWADEAGLGPASGAAWLRVHGSLDEAVRAARRGRVSGVAPERVAAVRRATSDAGLRRAAARVALVRKAGYGLAALGTGGYPPLLAELSDPPPLLYLRGRLPRSLLACGGRPPSVAVVGTRRASPWGMAFAHILGRDLAAGGTVVVSGLALGIDGAAHRGALSAQDAARSDVVAGAGGTTIAVLAGGLDAVHPPAHESLAESIAEHGALLSEHPPGVRPRRGSFPRRNRIVAGLATAVAVVEAPFRSGVRHTVEVAAEAGRDVWVVPRRPDSEIGRAAAALLADGAGPLTSADDLHVPNGAPDEASGVGAVCVPTSSVPICSVTASTTRDPVERAVIDRLARHGASDLDALSGCGATVLTVLAALARLEERGAIRADEGGRWHAVRPRARAHELSSS